MDKENFKLLYEAYQNGNAQAANDLGVLFATGNENEKIPQNFKEAFSLFCEAANAGNTEGMNNLARCYRKGDGVDKNPEIALELLNEIRRIKSEYAEHYIATKRVCEEEQKKQNPFFLVKITDYAKSMLDGTIYMRPLSAFWNFPFENTDPSVNNNYRGDSHESITESYDENNIPREHKNFFNNTGIRFKNAAQQDLLLSQNMIYCLYVLEFDKAENKFVLPDKRIADFGDTAVIIYNCEEFLKRVTAAKILQCGYSSWMSFKQVKYNFDFEKNQSYNEFCKGSNYAWQNEFRISIDVSEGYLNEKNWEKTSDWIRLTTPLLCGCNPNIPEQLSLKIDMSNICISMPISEFLQLKNFDKSPINKFIPPPHFKMLSMDREPFATVYRIMEKRK